MDATKQEMILKKANYNQNKTESRTINRINITHNIIEQLNANYESTFLIEQFQ